MCLIFEEISKTHVVIKFDKSAEKAKIKVA